MGKIYLSDFVDLKGEYDVSEKLCEWQERYPASPFINIFYLKLIANRVSVNKSKLLLTILNRHAFQTLSVQAMPDIDLKKEALSLGVVRETHAKDETAVHPVFVKHNIDDSENKHEMIDQLIEKFSEDAPKIIYSPEKHDANANYGEDSLGEDPDIVSETLANIYAEQGCIAKAIQMYEILQLHFPEKSCYFATRIKTLNEKNINK